MAMGKRYFFRSSLDAYKNNYFDRIIHYLIWGIICNVVFILYIGTSTQLELTINVFNSAGKIANILKDITNNIIPTQLAIF
jgi:hypothetical protein